MELRRKRLALASALLFSLLGTPFPYLAAASGPPSGGATIRHHDLFVQIDPDHHALVATDRVTIDVPQGRQVIRLSLAPTLHLDRLALSGPDQPLDESSHEIPFET